MMIYICIQHNSRIIRIQQKGMEENISNVRKQRENKLFSLVKAKHRKKLAMYHEHLMRKKMITSSIVANESALNQEIYSNCLISLQQSYLNKKKQFRSYILNNLPNNSKYPLQSTTKQSQQQQNQKPEKKRSIVDSNKNITLKAKNCHTGYSNWLKPMDSPLDNQENQA